MRDSLECENFHIVISKKFDSSENTKLKMRGCSKREIGIDQFGFSGIDELPTVFLIYLFDSVGFFQ